MLLVVPLSWEDTMLVRWGLLPGGVAGFTGTRYLISAPQRARLMSFLIVKRPVAVHYGDCTGADYEMFRLAHAVGVKTVSHPPDKDLWRMFTLADEIREPKDYYARDRDIVDETDFLVACPELNREQPSGGTWYTVRYARELGRMIAVVWPDGRVDFQSPSGLHWGWHFRVPVHTWCLCRSQVPGGTVPHWLFPRGSSC